MAQDYHIYIHSTEKQEQQSKTSPWKTTTNDAFKNSSSISAFSSKVASTGSFEMASSVGAAFKGFVAKASPWIAAIIAAIKITDKVMGEVVQFKTIIGGDYSEQIAYNNFHATINAFTHPITTQYNYYKQKYRNINLDQTSKLTNQLHGDDYINSFNGLGV